MCISGIVGSLLGGLGLNKLLRPKAPPAMAPAPDPGVERAKAETEAAQVTNSKLAAKNRARQASSLLAKPLDSTTSEVSALGASPGKRSLGQ